MSVLENCVEDLIHFLCIFKCNSAKCFRVRSYSLSLSAEHTATSLFIFDVSNLGLFPFSFTFVRVLSVFLIFSKSHLFKNNALACGVFMLLASVLILIISFLPLSLALICFSLISEDGNQVIVFKFFFPLNIHLRL